MQWRIQVCVCVWGGAVNRVASPPPPSPDIHNDILDLSSLDHWTTGQLTPSQCSHCPYFFLDPPLP